MAEKDQEEDDGAEKKGGKGGDTGGKPGDRKEEAKGKGGHADDLEQLRKEQLKKKVDDAVGGAGRVTMEGAELASLVKESFQDLVDRGVLVRDPETGEYDTAEEVEKRKKGRDGAEKDR